MKTSLDQNWHRYEKDPAFHAVVNILRDAIGSLRLSPNEVREAAMFAVYLNESRSPNVRVVLSDLERVFDEEELSRNYRGGYADEEQKRIFDHGMATVCNVAKEAIRIRKEKGG